MNGLTRVMFHRSQRLLRGLLLLVMAWLLGASGLAHTHAAAPARPAPLCLRAVAQAAAPVLAVASENEDCAICWWKARTPYVSPLAEPAPVPVLAGIDHRTAAPRAPPATTLDRPRTRAPPRLLS